MSEIIVDLDSICSKIVGLVNNLPLNVISSEEKSEIQKLIENIQSKFIKFKKSIFVRTVRGQQLSSQMMKTASSIVKILDNLANDPSLNPRMNDQINEFKLQVERMEREIRRRTLVVT